MFVGITQVDGIDLSLLTSALTPVEKLGRGEQDTMWDFDTVFAELASEMQRELDGDREEGEDTYAYDRFVPALRPRSTLSSSFS